MKTLLFLLTLLFTNFDAFSQKLKGKFRYAETSRWYNMGMNHIMELYENQRFTYYTTAHLPTYYIYNGTWTKKDNIVFFTPDPVKYEDTATIPPKIIAIKKYKRKDLENSAKKAFSFYDIYSNSMDTTSTTSIAWGSEITVKNKSYFGNDKPIILDSLTTSDSIKIKSPDYDLTFNIFKKIPDIEEYQEFHVYSRIYFTIYNRAHYEKMPFDKALLLNSFKECLFVDRKRIFMKLSDK